MRAKRSEAKGLWENNRQDPCGASPLAQEEPRSGARGAASERPKQRGKIGPKILGEKERQTTFDDTGWPRSSIDPSSGRSGADQPRAPAAQTAPPVPWPVPWTCVHLCRW